MKRSLLFCQLAILAVGLVPVAACGKSSGRSADKDGVGGTLPSSANAENIGDSDVLVTVNGVPIRESDLHYVLARDDRGKGRGVEEAKAKATLEKIIEAELHRQQAVAEGLDQDPEHIRRRRFMEAPLNDFNRTSLAEALFKQHLAAATAIDDGEARSYFESHRDRFQTEFHLHQILVKDDEAKIQAIKQQLESGTSFEAAATSLYPPEMVAAGSAPWDLGFLAGNQLPDSWRDALENLKDGQVSEILRGPNNRAWIIRVIERRRDESVTFEKVKPALLETMKATKALAASEEQGKALRAKAAVNYLREPTAVPPPPEPED